MRPEIYIENETITIEKGKNVNILEGVTAEDNIDNKEELTAKITAEGTVNVDKVGEYNIKYKVTDSSGWSAERTRTYKVIDKKNIKVGTTYICRIYNQNYNGGYADSKITFNSGNKVTYVAVTGMDISTYTGTYTIKDDIVTAKVEYHDLYLGDDVQTLKFKIQDENTIKDLNTGYVYKTK